MTKVIPGIAGGTGFPSLSTPRTFAIISCHDLESPGAVVVVVPSGFLVSHPWLFPNIVSFTVVPILLTCTPISNSIASRVHFLNSSSVTAPPSGPRTPVSNSLSSVFASSLDMSSPVRCLNISITSSTFVPSASNLSRLPCSSTFPSRSAYCSSISSLVRSSRSTPSRSAISLSSSTVVEFLSSS